MANLHTSLAGIQSPNPFWLASAPPTDKAYNVIRAFEAGWGGVVWKTLGEAGPAIVNVNGPRYDALLTPDRRLVGFNNIELITDRDLELNLTEIRQVKRDWPDRALVVSIMVPCQEASWKAILARVEDTGADGIELNFGCPHGMSERGMGAAVGQVPEYIEMVTAWCKHYSKLPVIVKLTPNITDIRLPARAAKKGGADAVSLINTINSIMGVDPATLSMSEEHTSELQSRQDLPSSPTRRSSDLRHPPARPRGKKRRRRCGLAHQHHQLHHGRRSGHPD